MDSIDPAATAWLLASTALVLLMTPGLAIFYGGMVRTTGVLNMIMMSFIAIPLVTVAWLLVGYTLAFSGDVGGGLIGDLTHVGMLGIGPGTAHGAVPELLYATFQLSFAIITAALVSGAIADRARFAAWMVFVPVWSIVVYSVVAHWVWAPDGWLFKLGVLDYAGGLVVEIVADPFRWTRTLQALEAEKLPVVEFPHSPSRLTAATTDLYSAAVNRRLTHSGDPRLAAHVGAAVIVEDARGMRLSKQSRSRTAPKIDLAACLVMAHSRAVWRSTHKKRRRSWSFAS